MGKRATKVHGLAAILLGGLLGVSIWHSAQPYLDRTGFSQSVGRYIEHARLDRELRSHALIAPSEKEHGLSPDSLVLLVHSAAREGGTIALNGGPAMAFAIGDGSLVLTAAHCLDWPAGKDCHGAISKQVTVLSPFYGDEFEATVVAVDREADLAALRPSWKGHPALLLGDPEDLCRIREVYVATRSFNEEDPLVGVKPKPGSPARFDCRARMEVVSVRGVDAPGLGRFIHLGSTRYIANGWSGSPLIDTRTKTVSGMLTQLHLDLPQGKLTKRTALGTNLATVCFFLRRHGLMESALARPSDPVRPEHAAEAFALAVKSVETLNASEFATSRGCLEKMVGLRPHSSVIHLQLAYRMMATAPAAGKDEGEDHPAEVEVHILKAIELDPNNPWPRIVYTSLLRKQRRHAEALTQAEAALALDPNDDLALASRVDVLAATDPNRCLAAARTLIERRPDKAYAWLRCSEALRSQRRVDEASAAARKATDLDPNDGRCWWTLADLLRSQQRFGEAVEAAQKAVDLDPNDVSDFRPRLANCLSKAGRLKDAEQVYQLMLSKYPQRAYFWFWYAEYLADHYPDRIEQASQALDKASDPNAQWRVDPNELASLRRRIGVAD